MIWWKRYEKTLIIFSNTYMVEFQMVIMIMETQEKINWANRMELEVSMPSSAFLLNLMVPFYSKIAH